MRSNTELSNVPTNEVKIGSVYCHINHGILKITGDDKTNYFACEYATIPFVYREQLTKYGNFQLFVARDNLYHYKIKIEVIINEY